MQEKHVVYNPASICSVLAAAYYIYICTNSTDQPIVCKAFRAGNKVTLTADLTIWVGVQPSKNILKSLANNYAIYPDHGEATFIQHGVPSLLGYNKNITIPPRYADALTPPANKGVDDWINTIAYLPDSAFKSVLKHNYNLTCDSLSGEILSKTPQWYVAKLAAEFEAGTYLSLEDQSLVWANYKNSLSYLADLSSQYEFISWTQPRTSQYDDLQKSAIECGYLQDLKAIKQELTMVFETTSFTIDGNVVTVPLINIDQTKSPLFLRMMSNTYDYAMTYVQRQGRNVYTAFSRIVGFDKLVLELVKSQRIPAIMSNQM